ncbi:lipoprotein-releasing ABC transporter permease subunit [Pseudoalteromonas tunicata]|uniref:Putative lipoprotein releasing system transmembrane protein n=1 Tax=Pseudoalteromonas tunicata D2 TaxID=87626 RepID=A4CC39_9GAMM|nr:lipoprotein-releasing ABC transporter permease subunit [Pseudoalteromonas tunicata]ATC94475.1 lipoprotein-releasing system permease protein [Pseudoalteromonas tunicata]AXT30204.1 lipoprotein-releasing ABC transporter permease subunit [Pseudoalteromonas tunicata]EAR27926.1 putative lipoprotein releasing system transmembrane protein [Pseudoalteromonas tunicata D2]
MNLSLFLSQRFRKAKRDNGFIGFIGKASSAGIGLGIAVLIVALSVFNGFEQQLVERLLAVVPHVEYEAPNRPINNWPSKVKQLADHSEVAAASPFIKLNGMAQFKNELKAVEVSAIDPAFETEVSDIGKFISPTPLQALQKGQIILGKQIFEALGVNIGDSITVLLPNLNTKSDHLAAAKKLRLVVVGQIAMGGPVDHSTGLIHLSQAQDLLDLSADQVMGLRLKLYDVFNAHRTAMSIGSELNDYVYVNTWFRSQGNLYQDIQMVRTIIYLVVFLIIAVASFNIVSTLVMEVKEKQSNIAILKTMGATDRMIIMTFMLHGMFQAFVGMLGGTLLGVGLALSLPDIFLWWNQLSGTNVLAGVYFVEFLPSKLVVSDIAVTLLVTFIMTSIATIYPAWQASRIDPAKVLGQ